MSSPSPGDSGVGKTVILENLLKQLGQEGGASTKGGTVLGKVFHPADKNQALLSSISTLTKVGGDESDGQFINLPHSAHSSFINVAFFPQI